MVEHAICLTIDTDPDGLNAYQPDRRDLSWDGLHFAMETFHHALPDVPLTWYVRADGQLDYAYSDTNYLFNRYHAFWQAAIKRGDELGWHPHLYQMMPDGEMPQIMLDEHLALAELQRIHEALPQTMALQSFRMGEAWHTPATLNLVESLGYRIDSTAIPGRDDSLSGHPRNWSGAPNHPYYPAHDDICQTTTSRLLLEVPMNSWYFQASYDKQPKLRYMNPCIHADLWEQALRRLFDNLPQQPHYLWNLILHPSEAMPADADMLYAHDLQTMVDNLKRLEHIILGGGDSVMYQTISQAATGWR